MISNGESKVVTYIQKGFSNQEIANQLGVSVKTVKFHLTNIFKKYGVKSRSELLSTLVGWKSQGDEMGKTEIVSSETKAVALTQQDKIKFIDDQFKVGTAIEQLHGMMKNVTKDEINPATVNAACNCVARLNETINTAITAARFLNER